MHLESFSNEGAFMKPFDISTELILGASINYVMGMWGGGFCIDFPL